MTFTFWDVLITVAVMLAMIIPGYAMRKAKMLPKESVSALAAILLYCCQPFLTVKSFVLSTVTPTRDIVLNMLIMLALAIAVHLIVFLIVRLFFIKDKDKLRAGAYTACSLFSNAGFIGIPFVALLTKSDEAVIYATMFNCAFNALIWTLGVYIITNDRKMMRPAKAVLNPAVIVLVIALPLFFIPEINIFKMNDTVSKFVSFFGDMTLPVSMFIVGIRMAGIPLKEFFTNAKLYFVSAVKLIIAPLIAVACILPFFLTNAFAATDSQNYIILVLIILMAVPPAASTIALSEKFGGDVDNSIKTFVLATVMSVITLPALLTLLLLFLG